MIWDMSQVYANSGFLDSVATDLGLPASGNGGGTGPTTTSATATTLTTVTKTTTTAPTTTTATGTVGQWDQVRFMMWRQDESVLT